MQKDKCVLVFGEVLVDLFLNSVTYRDAGTPEFNCVGLGGGAPCNVAAYLSHLGDEVSFMGSLADDQIAAELQKMLELRGINTERCIIHPNTRSPLAVVMPLPGGDREFRLYLEGSAVEAISPQHFDSDSFQDASWFHFGSVLLAFPASKLATKAILAKLAASNVICSYDINIRPDIWRESKVDKAVLLDILSHVDVLKLSEEDFAWIQANLAPDLNAPQDLLRYGCSLISYTQGEQGAALITSGQAVQIPAPKVQVVDATGAGDSYMAGLIHGFRKLGCGDAESLQARLTEENLLKCGEYANQCAAIALSQKGALPPLV